MNQGAARIPEKYEFKDKGVWIFVGIDLAIFALFFLVFLTERVATPDVFLASQAELNPVYGFINTAVLVTSSWLLVLALKTMVANHRLARRYLTGAILMGLIFIVSKCFEYYGKISAGITIVDNVFFSFYYILTFIHLCHVIGGLVALKVVHGWVGQPVQEGQVAFAESVGIYWHMVDLLWIYLFLLLYLLR